MNGLILLAWIVGLLFLAGCVWFACWLDSAPVEPGEYSRLDELDGLPRGVVEHEARMDARAAERGYVR